MQRTRLVNALFVTTILFLAAGTVVTGASIGANVGGTQDATETNEALAEGLQETETTTVQGNETASENETAGEAEQQAAITFENQTSNGSTLTVDQVTLANDGFVAVHGTFGHVVGQSESLEAGTHENVTIEVGGSMPAATYPGNVTDLEAVDQNMTAGNETRNVTVSVTQEFVAVVHDDTNDNQEFDYVATQGANDSAYVNDEGRMVWDNATIEFDEIGLVINDVPVEELDEEQETTENETTAVEETETDEETTVGEGTETETTPEETVAVDETDSNVTVSNQTSNGSTVVVNSARLPEGGFVALALPNQTDAANQVELEQELVRDPNRTTLGVSEHLDAGEHQNVTVQLNESVDIETGEEQTVIAVLHRDSNDNQEYEFDSSDGGEDAPYEFQNELITDDATVTFTTAEDGDADATAENETETDTTTENETETDAGTETETAAENETDAATETETVTENGANETTAEASDGEVAETFVFDGETSGWIARTPSDIEGEENPTLELEAGETYNFTWVNTDGRPHNIVITDSEGNTIVRTEVISGEGGRQSVEFTAPEDGGTYYCEVHPGSMRGEVQIVEGE